MLENHHGKLLNEPMDISKVWRAKFRNVKRPAGDED